MEPTTGQRCCLCRPRLEGACLAIVLHEWRQALPAEPWAVVLDLSGAHTSGAGRWPDGGEPGPLPPYSPELNPAEWWFKALRAPLSNRVHDRLETVETS